MRKILRTVNKIVEFVLAVSWIYIIYQSLKTLYVWIKYGSANTNINGLLYACLFVVVSMFANVLVDSVYNFIKGR